MFNYILIEMLVLLTRNEVNQLNMDFYELGKRIKTERKKKKITQEELAEKVGLSVQHINNIENNRKKCSLETFVKIANVLSVSTDYLLQNYLEIDKPSKITFLGKNLQDSTPRELDLIAQIIDSAKYFIRKNNLNE